MLDGATIFMITRIFVIVFLLWLLYRLVRSCVFRMRGDQERAKHLRGQLMGFVIAFVLLWPFTGIRLQQRYLEWRYRPRLYEVAGKLGYTPADFLVEDSDCEIAGFSIPPFMSESCVIYLYFTTDMAVADLEPLVAQFPADHIRIVERHDSIAGAFSRLNFRTPSLIAVTEDQDPARGGLETKIHNYEWIIYQSDNSFQHIWLYETAAVAGLVFDSNPIGKNIIFVDVGIGEVHLY